MKPEMLAGMISELDANTRADREKREYLAACRMTAEGIVGGFRHFVGAIAPYVPEAPSQREVPEIVLGHRISDEHGSGRIIATIVVRESGSAPYSSQSVAEAEGFRVSYAFRPDPPEVHREGAYAPQPPDKDLEADEAFSISGLMWGLEEATPLDDHVLETEQALLTTATRDARDTLQLLWGCALDEALNPELAQLIAAHDPLQGQA